MAPADERSIDELVDSVPWDRLAHAYGFAVDAPAMLRAAAVESDAFAIDDWLFSAITHQGTPYSATAPTLWLMRRIVESGSGHYALGSCLGAVAVCATALEWWPEHDAIESEERSAEGPAYRSPPGDPVWSTPMPPGYVAPPKTAGKVHEDYWRAASPDITTLKASVLDWHDTIARCLTERAPLEEALDAGCAVVRVWPQGVVADALAAVAADHTLTDADRTGALLALAGSGVDVDALSDPGNRSLRFALAFARPDEQDHLRVLIEALREISWIHETFPRGLPGAEPWLTAALISTILDRASVDDVDEVFAAALTGVMSRTSGPLGATHEWGPVLAWAFPDRVQEGVVREVPLPESVSPLQARLLTALVANDAVWAPRSGNDILALRRVGLPHDRAAITRLLGGRPERSKRWWRRS